MSYLEILLILLAAAVGFGAFAGFLYFSSLDDNDRLDEELQNHKRRKHMDEL